MPKIYITKKFKRTKFITKKENSDIKTKLKNLLKKNKKINTKKYYFYKNSSIEKIEHKFFFHQIFTI